MILISDSSPDTSVQGAEFQRLLGYPRDLELEGRALELSNDARAWYAEHGRPWIYARQADSLDITGDAIVIEGVSFRSPRFMTALRDARAESVVLVAVSAGEEVEREAERRWKEDKPDEYFFLEVFGSAVVEHLVMMAGAQLCATTDRAGLAVLPHYSPGYPDWDIADQSQLISLLTRDATLPGDVTVLDSGMLRPKKSLLAVFGLTRATDHVRKLTDLVPCQNCTLPRCDYRRAPYLRPRRRGEVESMRPADIMDVVTPRAEPLDVNARYSVNAKALKRWAAERLSLVTQDDGTIAARFRYEGTTCSNMGRPLSFEYAVTVGTREDRYRILSQECGPTSGDDGYTFMCRYRVNASALMASIDAEKPLLGQPLNDVLSWTRPAAAATCYCEEESRAQKWGAVLETIHYALVQREKAQDETSPIRELQTQ
ncbi:MAG: hypothetical protein ABIT20_03430 [Gemmatimonadaceae bacterium]